MAAINKKFLVREANTYENYGTGGVQNVTLISIDLSSFHGFNYGNSGNYAKATLRLRVCGVRGSSATRQHGEWLIFLERSGNTTPSYNAYAHANNDAAGVTFDTSGNLFRVRLNVLGTTNNPTVMLAEIDGPLIDLTP